MTRDDEPQQTPTRAEHLAWCKQRALKYVERSDLHQAWSSMASDLSKHEGTRDHPAIKLGYAMMLSGHLSTAGDMRVFIEGFN